MKRLWLYSVRAYLKLGLFFYFKKIQVFNLNNVPKDKPVLFLANHQNALLDPLLIATNCNRFLYFLTRAGVFKKAFISKIFASLQMLPVYRIRDGWSNLTNNTAIFDRCSSLLSKNEAILIFPEGSHNIVRTVRPLSKGFTRIVFDTLDKYPDTDLHLIPVGLNFINSMGFPDSTSIYYGEPIRAKDFVFKDKNTSIVKLKTRIQLELSKLTTHIPSDQYSLNLEKLNQLNVDFLKPTEVNKCLQSNFQDCKPKQKDNALGLKRILKFLLKTNLIGPYVVWRFKVKPKIKEIEFMSTFRFALAITLVPLWIFILVFTLAYCFGWTIAMGYLVATIILALLAVKV